jgi:hypothetical protein
VVTTEEWSFPSGPHLNEGDLFLSAGAALKGFGKAAGIPAGTWASGANMNNARGRAGFATGAIPGHVALVYGGTGGNANVEQYDGTSWTEKNNLSTGRSGSGGGTLTSAITAGGEVPGSPANSALTETWDGTNWSSASNLNTARRALCGFGTSSTSALAAAGYTTTNVNLTEVWNGSSWTEVNDQNDTKNGRGGQGTTTAGILAGGSPPTSEAETWDGTSWTEIAEMNTAREYPGLSGQSFTQVIAAGGYVGPSGTAVNEFWNGTSWTEINDISTARYQPMGNGSAVSGILCGGDDGSSPNPSSALTEEFVVSNTLSTVTVS